MDPYRQKEKKKKEKIQKFINMHNMNNAVSNELRQEPGLTYD